MKAPKPPKPKKISFSLIPPMDNGHEPEAYRLLRQVRDKWHPDLEGAKIALAWRKRLKADKDGHLILGKCMKASDLQRELVNWDFVILLNQEVFQDTAFTLEKRLALIDHELCHATRALDKWFAPANDEKGRAVWRMRKHDIEEFRCIVDRYGCYKQDLVKFAEVLLKHGGNLVFPGMDETIAQVRIDLPTSAETKPPNTETVVITRKPDDESTPEERVRTRAAKRRKKLLGPDAPPDKRTSFPHGANEVQS
jgi:hypothetical protein